MIFATLALLTATSAASDLRANLSTYLVASFNDFNGVIRGAPQPAPGPENRIVYHQSTRDYHTRAERCEARDVSALRTTYERPGYPSLSLRGAAAPYGYALTLDVAPASHPLRLPSSFSPAPCWSA